MADPYEFTAICDFMGKYGDASLVPMLEERMPWKPALEKALIRERALIQIQQRHLPPPNAPGLVELDAAVGGSIAATGGGHGASRGECVLDGGGFGRGTAARKCRSTGGVVAQQGGPTQP